MAKIEIRCPICKKWSHIEISDDLLKNVSKGLLALNITTGMICEHSFIAYVDKNLKVRDCLVADFKIELQENSMSQATDEILSPEADIIKFDLIKLNLPDLLIVNILRTIFLRKKAVILSEEQFLYNHIINFFKYITQNSFKFDINIISEEDYKKNKNDYESHIILKKREVIRDKDKIIDLKRLDFEKSMVQKFLAEYDVMAGLVILKNEINKAYEFSKEIAELIESQSEKPITAKIIINYLSEKHKEKIQKPYLTFLIDIVKNYFKVDVPKIDGVTNLLGLL
ncbi:MAG: hypothetical protein ACFE9I_01015 [Candidatus Hermodarchaeota archaeon]